MTKRISINLPEETYEKIKTLSEHFNKDEEQIIATTLEAIGEQENWIIHRSKDYKVPIEFENVLYHFLDAAYHSTGLFSHILEKLEVNGLYVITDVEYDFDEDYYLSLYYDSLDGNPLLVDSFYLEIERGFSFGTFSHIEIDKNTERSLEKLEKVVADTELQFDILDGNLELDGGDELLTLKISVVADTMDRLPSITEVSKIVKKIFKKAGIKSRI